MASVLGFRPSATSLRSQLLDPWLLFAGLLLLTLGLLMVTSASMPIAAERTGQPFYYLIRQGIYITVGLITAITAFYIPTGLWRRCSPVLLLLAIVLLTLVLVPGIGKEVKGSMRWIDLGVTNLQLELMLEETMRHVDTSKHAQKTPQV